MASAKQTRSELRRRYAQPEATQAHLALTEPALRPCPRAQPYLYDDSGEELSQFILALLSENGTWIADLPVAASQVLGKDYVLAAGQGVQVHTSGRKVLRLGTDDAHLSRQQLRVDVDAQGVVSVTRVAPNPSYLQRAKGARLPPPPWTPRAATHTPPALVAPPCSSLAVDCSAQAPPSEQAHRSQSRKSFPRQSASYCALETSSG